MFQRNSSKNIFVIVSKSLLFNIVSDNTKNVLFEINFDIVKKYYVGACE